jgi:hypothetical protein
MRKVFHLLSMLFLCGVGFAGCARHADRAVSPLPELVFHKPSKATTEERLELKVVSKKEPGQRPVHSIFLGAQRFRSVDVLLAHLRALPKGTEVYYDYSCLGIRDRPLAQYEELVAFQQRCEKMGILLVLEYGTQKGRVKTDKGKSETVAIPEYGQAREGKGRVLMMEDIRGVAHIEKDETLYSLWQRVGPGEPCEVCGSRPQVVKLIRYIDGKIEETRYYLKKMTEAEFKSVSLKDGDRLIFMSVHL